MNEELKEALKERGVFTREHMLRYRTAKARLEAFDAASRNATRADGVKRTEADIDALVTVMAGRGELVSDLARADAELEGCKVATQCLLAEVSLVCSETAAMSRIAGQ